VGTVSLILKSHDVVGREESSSADTVTVDEQVALPFVINGRELYSADSRRWLLAWRAGPLSAHFHRGRRDFVPEKRIEFRAKESR
jgi:hypothetical protein